MVVCEVWFLRCPVVVRVGMFPDAVFDVHLQRPVAVATLRTSCLLIEVESAVIELHRC